MRRAGNSYGQYVAALAAHRAGKRVVMAGSLEIARDHNVAFFVPFQLEPGDMGYTGTSEDAARAAQEVGG